jgi:hypothetical protein
MHDFFLKTSKTRFSLKKEFYNMQLRENPQRAENKMNKPNKKERKTPQHHRHREITTTTNACRGKHQGNTHVTTSQSS